MKLLVETKGPFMLVEGDQEIPSHRPAVVTKSNFVSHRISINQVHVHGEVTDEATDKEFAKFVEESKGDMPLAVESFLSKFAVVKVTEKEGKKSRKSE